MDKWLFFSFAIFFLILIPFAPQLVRLRIRIMKWLHWTWAVNLLESHFESWVLFFRIFLFVIAAALIGIGWTR